MIRQRFTVKDGLWACAGCGAAFLPDGYVEHPAGCPQMKPVTCRHELMLESCAECYPPARQRAQDAAVQPDGTHSAADWNKMSYQAQAGEQRKSRFGPWITASYGGSCPGCGQRFDPGERIRADDELGDFVCEACGSQPEAARVRETMD